MTIEQAFILFFLSIHRIYNVQRRKEWKNNKQHIYLHIVDIDSCIQKYDIFPIVFIPMCSKLKLIFCAFMTVL